MFYTWLHLGITPEHLAGAPPLDVVLREIRSILRPKDIIVGHSVHHGANARFGCRCPRSPHNTLGVDVHWLGLRESVDFHSTYDIAKLFAVGNPPGHRFPSRIFSLRHLVLQLFDTDIQSGAHSPVADAYWSMQLFRRYVNSDPLEMSHVRQLLLSVPPPAPFSRQYPTLDGVSLVFDPGCVNCRMPSTV